MLAPLRDRRVGRFGPYEVHLATGELRKHGIRLKLQDQPFQILVLLLTRPRKLVTREEIRQQLWPSGTFVDFDNGLNTALSRLREVLGDSAESPRYIETLARRGYRWLVPVDWMESRSADLPPAIPSVAPSEVATTPDNLIGKKVSHYRVLELLDAGGMGIVYKAEDLKLGRRVALKFLPQELARNSSALERFEREARAASALNHPNICTIYEFEEYEGHPFIVMELMDGQTLRERIANASAPFQTNELIDLAIQITDGLDTAHQKGIIHRDIKPANIFVTSDDQAKILDFGLAKLAPIVHSIGEPSDPNVPDDVVQRTPGEFEQQAKSDPLLSRTGVAMGTAGYMSPEQVRGEKLDARTDLFSFGLVLYEMATGQRAFKGDTVPALQKAILCETPAPVRDLNPEVPAKLQQIIMKTLERSRETRYQAAVELRADLETVKQDMRPPRSVAWTVVVSKLRASRWKHVGLASASVVLLSSAMGFWWMRAHTSHVPGTSSAEPLIRSLAVLPLENLSGDPAQEYFADGMTDELITDLGQIDALRVISRTSIMKYKGAHKLLPEIAKELNIDAVVEGTVVHSGEHVRITAQLIEAHTDKHLWAQSYEGEMRDIMGLQNQVARAIADQIRVKLTPQQKATLGTAAVVNPKAHELYLQGQYFNEKTADEGTQKAIVLYQQAIAVQPDHALAHIGLANAYIRLGHTLALPPEKAFPAAKAAALKALEINDNNGEAHAALGQVKFLHDWDFSGAEKEFQRAVALSPSSERAQNAYASFLNAMGRPNEAVAHVRVILQINPVSLWAIEGLSAQLYWARRYDEAVEQARKSVEMDPNRVNGYLWLGLALEQKHDFPESIARLEKAAELSHDKAGMAFVAHARALSGDKAGARKILSVLEQRSNREYVSPWWMAMVYPDLGNKEKAFFWLEKAYRGREHDLVFSKVWPMFDSLRMDPRYKDLMRRVGLPQTDTGRSNDKSF